MTRSDGLEKRHSIHSSVRFNEGRGQKTGPSFPCSMNEVFTYELKNRQLRVNKEGTRGLVQGTGKFGQDVSNISRIAPFARWFYVSEVRTLSRGRNNPDLMNPQTTERATSA
jgi:hypothetical protein